MNSKTELIYRTALIYAQYKNKPITVNDELLNEIFRDLNIQNNPFYAEKAISISKISTALFKPK